VSSPRSGDAAPRRAALYGGLVPGQPAAITWLGHATVLVEVDGVRLLTDPVLGKRVGPLVRIAPPVAAHLSQRVDGVLLSHLHADHTDLPSLRALTGDPQLLAPAGAGSWLRKAGMTRVCELAPGEQTSVDGLMVTATPAIHDDRRRPLGPRGVPVGFLVLGSRRVYFAGDTDLFDDMAKLRGNVDLALLPVWGWGSKLGPGHLDPQRAAEAAAVIAPSVAVPIHYGTLALSRPARRPPDPAGPGQEFARLARELAPDVEVRILSPGERTEV